MMKVVHFIPSIGRASGGVGAYMQLLSKELGKMVELHIITCHSDDELDIEHATIHYIDRKLCHLHKEKKQFLRIMREVNPDIFHVNACWFPQSAATALWNKRYLKIPMVYSPHGMLEPWIIKRNYWTKKLPALLLYQRRAIAAADMVHATAESEKGNLLKLGYIGNVEVVPNCVDVENIEIKKSWERKKNILFLSRIHVKKGIHFLIEAVAMLKEQLNGYRIIIAGEGEKRYIEELKTLAKSKGVDEMISFVGGAFGDDKWQRFKDADIFVLPTYSENFGIVVTEALACGTPVITTKGTPWQELEACKCGWWTKIGTAPTAEALKQFLSKTEKDLEQMGRNGRKLVEEKYSVEAIAESMKALYDGVINGKQKILPTYKNIGYVRKEKY